MNLENVKQFVHQELSSVGEDKGQFGKKLVEVAQFLTAKYDEMTPEAQAYVDQVNSNVASLFDQVLTTLPDSKDKRGFSRLVAQARGKHFRAEHLAHHLLQMPVDDAQVITESEKPFYCLLQMVLDVMFDATRDSAQGIPTLPLIALHYWSVDELLVSYHVSRHHFWSQSYPHLRLVYEHLELIRLFRQQPKWVELWASGDTKRIIRELSPGGVRNKLGKQRFDPLYSSLTEMGAHGSFVGMRGRVGLEGKEPDGTNKIVAWVGGVPREDQIVFSIVWAMMSAVSVLASAIATFQTRLHAEEALELFHRAVEVVLQYDNAYFVPWAMERGVSVDEIVKLLKKAPEILAFYKASP